MKKVIRITYAKDYDLEREYDSVDEAVDAVRKAFAPLIVTASTASSEEVTAIAEDDWSVTGTGSRELVLVYWGASKVCYDAAVIEETIEED